MTHGQDAERYDGETARTNNSKKDEYLTEENSQRHFEDTENVKEILDTVL